MNTAFAFMFPIYLFLAGISIADYGSLTYYINDCVSDFIYENSHAYVGTFKQQPAQKVAKDTSMKFEIEYSRIPEEGSILDANFNYAYYPEGRNTTTDAIFHSWQNVNSNGKSNYTISPNVGPGHHKDTNVSYYVCFDDKSQVPQYVYMWYWFNNLDNQTSCRTKTNSQSAPC
eukprot:134842_1